MPRLARLVVPDVTLHVVQRGHDRQPCFRQDTDYLVYLATLHELLPKAGCALHAFCLMTNHVHLLLTPSGTQACARLIRDLGQRYVQYFNRRYERRGTLWEGRFRSCLVESSTYVLACYRYIERNPVRAGMVATAAHYRWSSYAANAEGVDSKLLIPHPEYVALSEDEADRRCAYRRLFANDDDPGFLAAVRDATNGGYGLLGAELKLRLTAQTGRHLDRKKPGPAPRPDANTDDLTAELGLRPRTS